MEDNNPLEQVEAEIKRHREELQRLNQNRSFPYIFLFVAAPVTIGFLTLTILSEGLLDFTTGITAALFFSLLITSAYLVLGQSNRDEAARRVERKIKSLSREKARLSGGRRGEHEVAYALKWLPRDYLVLNDITLVAPGLGRQQFDHLVVGPQGIFHLETKNINGAIIILPDGQWMLLRPGESGITKEGMESPAFQIQRHERVLRAVLDRCLPGYPIPVMSAVVLSHPRSLVEGQATSLTVLKKEQLLDYIANYPGERPLSPEQVRRVAVVLVQETVAEITGSPNEESNQC